MKKVALAFLLASSMTAAERNPANYERLLLPFNLEARGANAYWHAWWWFHNDGDTTADVFPLARYCAPFCAFPLRYSLIDSLPPKYTYLVAGGDVLPARLGPPQSPVEGPPPGAFLYVERAKMAQLSITGFLGRTTTTTFDNRRSVSSALRPIPESRFHSGTHSILLPSILAGSRYSLRIYALPENLDDPAITVRVIAIREIVGGFVDDVDTQLSSTVIRLATPQDLDRAQCIATCDLPHVPYRPAIAELPIDAGVRTATVRIEIEPASRNVRWWAIISATDSSDNVQLFESGNF
jgi:hypothetical protein